ncbi:MAG: uracil-DNA glycosylase [Deltaproteobacteria bacterium]|nr:uracil-DNA glycosylase [Deltaproteobacteria bacterium]
MVPGPDQTNPGRLVGQLQELLEFQKDWGRQFLPKSVKNQEAALPKGSLHRPYESGAALSRAIVECQNCLLARNRRQAVPGEGPQNSILMFIGEGPGFEEDQQGRPFVGPAGQLLTKMIQAINLTREEVYITNVVKCRPPENRDPFENEVEACRSFLEEEIRLVDPRILVPLGSCAAQTLTRTKKKISDLRGRILDFKNRQLIATYHPAYLLRNPGAKREAWEDLKRVRREYDGLQ